MLHCIDTHSARHHRDCRFCHLRLNYRYQIKQSVTISWRFNLNTNTLSILSTNFVKRLRYSFWWPTLARDTKASVSRCDRYVRRARLTCFAVDRTAGLNNWPNDKLTAIIQPVLVDKALKTFLALDSVESQDYNKVRAAILKAYAVVPEQSRVLFRTISKQSQETYGEFVSEIFLPQLFRRRLLACGQDRQQTLHTCYFWQAASAGVHSTVPAHSECAYAA